MVQLRFCFKHRCTIPKHQCQPNNTLNPKSTIDELPTLRNRQCWKQPKTISKMADSEMDSSTQKKHMQAAKATRYTHRPTITNISTHTYVHTHYHQHKRYTQSPTQAHTYNRQHKHIHTITNLSTHMHTITNT